MHRYIVCTGYMYDCAVYMYMYMYMYTYMTDTAQLE